MVFDGRFGRRLVAAGLHNDVSWAPDGGLSFGDNVSAEDRAAVEAIRDAFDPNVYSAEELIAYAADKRWQKEVGGIIVSGVPVATDDRSKLMITGARVAAQADPNWSTVWVGTDGNSYPLSAAQMIAISDAVADHVNAAFATFSTVKTAIEGGTMESLAEIDAAFA